LPLEKAVAKIVCTFIIKFMEEVVKNFIFSKLKVGVIGLLAHDFHFVYIQIVFPSCDKCVAN
jgi:hypothetical protein